MNKERMLEAARFHIQKGQKIYASPNIPEKKLNNALTSYAGEVNRDDILVLLDTTVFGSGKEGFVATAEGIYWKEAHSSPSSFQFSELESFEVEGSGMKGHIQFNEDIKISLVISVKDIELLYNFMNSVRLVAIQERKNSAAEDSEQADPGIRIDPQVAYFERDGLLGEERISEILNSLASDSGLSSQIDFAVETKRKEAKGSVGGGFGSIIVGVILGIYAFIGYAVTYLPFRAIAAFAVPVAIIGGIIMILKGTAKAALAPRTKLSTSIEDSCKEYYNAVFGKLFDRSVDASRIIDLVPGLFPAQVHGNYEDIGWRVLESQESPGTTSSSITCSACDKKADYGEGRNMSLPISDDALKKGIFLQCKSCNVVFCYECMDNIEPLESCFLCPACGRSTNGTQGLNLRWILCRYNYSNTKRNFDLHGTKVTLRPRTDPRVQDVDISLHGGPFGKVIFRNIAFKIDENWFLATPEPVIES